MFDKRAVCDTCRGIVEEWDVHVDIFVVTKTLQEVNALKEIPGRRNGGIGTLPKDPILALDFKDLSVWLTKHKKT